MRGNPLSDPTPCPSRQQLQDYLSGACSAEVTEEITAHLNECGQCRKTIAQSSENNAWLHSILTDNARSELLKRLEDNPQSHFGISQAYSIEGLIAQGILEVSDDANYSARLGNYPIVELIGSGGMGIVLKAYQADLDRPVALKILKPGLLSTTRKPSPGSPGRRGLREPFATTISLRFTALIVSTVFTLSSWSISKVLR